MQMRAGGLEMVDGRMRSRAFFFICNAWAEGGGRRSSRGGKSVACARCPCKVSFCFFRKAARACEMGGGVEDWVGGAEIEAATLAMLVLAWAWQE